MSYACTSVIVSSRATANGRPLMFKNRDTGELNNRIEYFKGKKFDFIGLVNSPSEGGEVWTGTNEAGFSIMNTASYNIKDDDVPDSQMDREGIIMYEALGVCRTVEDFRKFLEDHEKPLGVETNFGVIDAEGGAAYFEVNNHKYVMYDVNDPSVAPEGYRVVTNFSESGRYEEYSGWERYLTASDAMKTVPRDAEGKITADHNFIFNSFSRSYKHTLLGIDYDDESNIPESGVAVDQDFIPRKMTSAAIVVEGVKAGENPLHTVMWTVLGYPVCTIAVPLLVGKEDCLPSYVKKAGYSTNSELCDFAMNLKNEKIFTYRISNGSKYFNIAKANEIKKAVKELDAQIESQFDYIYSAWIDGKINDRSFFTAYLNQSDSYCKHYLALFAEND